MLCTPDTVIRWSIADGGLSLKTDAEVVTVSCGDVTVEAEVSGGAASITAEDAASLMPHLGTFPLAWSSVGGVVPTPVERVGSRYTTPDTVRASGRRNNDGFTDKGRYPDDMVWVAIQRAEEAIDSGTRRSFCRRSIETGLDAGFNELPVQDAVSISDGAYLANDRQAFADEDGMYTVEYGAQCDASITAAATMLAASFLRPRLRAEDARGESVDGVYIGYTLASGSDGSWTGLPKVDATIESHRSHRLVVM